MELKKLHLGTMSYAVDSMDEVAHQLATAFGVPPALGHDRTASLPTGITLATRGRRDMSSRVKDVVLALGLCHNVRSPFSLESNELMKKTGHTSNRRRWIDNVSSFLARRSSHCPLDRISRTDPLLPRPHNNVTPHHRRSSPHLRHSRGIPLHF